MRIAVIGQPGSGATTLARVLAVRLGVRAIDEVDELRTHATPAENVVLDGIPGSLPDLKELEDGPYGVALDHVLHLHVGLDVRALRIARQVVAGSTGPEEERRVVRTLPDLDDVVERLAATVPVTRIDASRSRTEVLTDALDTLGLTWG
ncbi:hypothetical protein [Marmoricola sp. RAF53]|uniref:hypothetical protein n=1 Tax=Marmoricola sp. RAF53 TaxID=3233059 RepID=UPI003F9DEF79